MTAWSEEIDTDTKYTVISLFVYWITHHTVDKAFITDHSGNRIVFAKPTTTPWDEEVDKETSYSEESEQSTSYTEVPAQSTSWSEE